MSDYSVKDMIKDPAALEVKRANMTAKRMWCICPEMKVEGSLVKSWGGETTQSWKHRDEDRKKGEDVPIGGCLCMIDDDIQLLLTELTISRES